MRGSSIFRSFCVGNSDLVHSVFLFGIILCFCSNSCPANISVRPHIVVIIADDLGWNDVGLHGSNQIPTPNIDALGYNGIIFNRHYTQQTCTPSRAALLTGQYPIRTGMQGFPLKAGEPRNLPPGVPTLPETLSKLGYSTHLIGKWHLGHSHRNVTPTGRGYHTHFGYWNGYVGYFQHEITQDNMTGLDMHENFEPHWASEGLYATDLFTVRAERLIEDHNIKEPLFLVVSHLAPHTGKDGTDMEVPDVDECNQKYSYIDDENRRLFAGVVNSLDQSVGRIVKSLADKGILNDTLVVFMSDNGAQTQGIHQNFGSNYPLRGLKFTLLEGGVRNVAVAWSSRFKHKSLVNNQFFHITDWLPTLYEYAGGNVSELGQLDGISQWESLVENGAGKREEMLLNIDEVRGNEGIIGEGMRYKLLNGSFDNGVYDGFYGENGRGPENPPYNIQEILESPTHRSLSSLNRQRGAEAASQLSEEDILQLRSTATLKGCRSPDQAITNCSGLCLFDLVADPCETTNLAEQLPNVVDKLGASLARYRRQLIPQTNTDVDPLSNPIYYNNVWATWLDYKGIPLYKVEKVSCHL